MFERQWFSSDSQLGLTPFGVQLEDLVWKKEYAAALNLLNVDCLTNYPTFYLQRQLARIQRLQATQISQKRHIDIMFRGFWPGFNAYDNPILDLISLMDLKVSVRVVLQDPDICFYSVFETPGCDVNDSATRILWLGENVRPHYTNFDLSISGDIYDYCGRNIHYPGWMFGIDWLKKGNSQLVPVHRISAMNYRIEEVKPFDICFVGSNHEPFRISMLRYFDKCGFKLGVFGKGHYPIEDKSYVLRQSRYVFCPENSWNLGYCTEKLVDAYLSGAVPLYWGGGSSLINKDSYVEIPADIDRKSLDDLAEIIRKIPDPWIPPLINTSSCYTHLKQSSDALYMKAFVLYE